MRDLWTVVRMEFVLTFRGKVIWIAGIVTAAFGIWSASMIRQNPFGGWEEIARPIFFMTLLLTFLTGDQIARDRSRRVEGVILSTPVSTSVYVCGKLFAGVGVLLFLGGIELLAAILIDQLPPGHYPLSIVNRGAFPPLGPSGYISVWLLTTVPDCFFGAALMLLGITLLRGQRVIAIVTTFVCWYAPFLLFKDGYTPIIQLLDISTLNTFYANQPDHSRLMNQFVMNMIKNNLVIYVDPIPREIAQPVMSAISTDLPPSSFTAIFWWNRALFIALAVLFLLGTMCVLHWQRKGLA